MMDFMGNYRSELSLISVIVPVYNVEKYIGRCIESILQQTYHNIEILLIDDGTEDNSGTICDDYARKDNRIIVYHKTNGGLSDARNYGIEKAEGEYITCIDSDDYVDEDYIEYLYSLQIKYNTPMSICQHRVLVGNKGRVCDMLLHGDELLSAKNCLKRMLYHDVIDTSAWAKLYHRDLFNHVSYPKGMVFEDIGTTYALILQCDNIAVGYEAKYNYVVHKNSIVNSRFSQRKLDMIAMTDKMADCVEARFPDLHPAVLRRRCYGRFSTLNQMLEVQDVEYKKIRQDIIGYLKKNAWIVIRDPNTPKRDKFAYLSLMLGFSFYKHIWMLYRMISRGK